MVQYLGESQRYRLIAYSDAAVYRPLEFTSRAAAVSALRHLVANIDENAFFRQDRASRIIFAADIDVDERQLRDAGLSMRT